MDHESLQTSQIGQNLLNYDKPGSFIAKTTGFDQKIPPSIETILKPMLRNFNSFQNERLIMKTEYKSMISQNHKKISQN